jgi:thiamine-phosphate pyrophosphorylase
MDERLVSWARAVKARKGLAHPVLWLFTDARRQPDPLPAIGKLPPGLAGVVFRHDGVPGRACLARRVAALCRKRRLALTIAGDTRLAAALKAGVHLRGAGGRPAGGCPLTASAHTVPQLLRGLRRGALVFLSPAFPTASHAGAPSLGPLRWSALARGKRVLALGGVDGQNIRRLAGACGAGAIAALGAGKLGGTSMER